MLTSFHGNYLRLARLLIVVWLLALVLASLAHAGHDHEKGQSQHQTCDYCIGFAHISGAASAPTLLAMQGVIIELATRFESIASPQHLISAAQARAPPAL